MKAAGTDIPGLQMLGEIGRGAYTIVYRARRGPDTFAVKLPRDTSAQGLADATLRFRREAAVLARIHHPGLASIVEVGDVAGYPYLVMEHLEGRTLASILADGPVPEDRILTLTRTVVGALAELHRRGFVHRDIKPQNIVVDATHSAKLIDFGFVAQANTEEDPEAAYGTLRYSAPEQSGLLKRPVDGRSDLYALGAVLFECTTGQPPFQAADIGELIHQHAVVLPPDARSLNPAISPALAAIIAKLLAKDPDDRYQTARGLLADLEEIASLNAALRSGQNVVLGVADDAIRRQDETPVVGRDDELLELAARWRAVRQGSGMVVLVEGEAGSGKSRLVRELLHRIQDRQVLILTGKCAGADPTPLASLRSLVDDHIASVRRLPEPARRQAESCIVEAAAEFAPLLKHFTPSLAHLLASAPDLPTLAEAHDQFYDAVASFLLRLASSHAATALVLDDVQWLDETSRLVLKRLTQQVATASILFIATARNDPDCAESLQRFVVDTGPALALRLPLVPLGEPAVAKLVAEHLGGHSIDRSIVQRIASRSNGNALAIGEYVHAMLEAGLLRPHRGSWLVDTAGLDSLQLPTDVIQLVVKHIDDLSEPIRTILSTAAVLGPRFRLETLALVAGRSSTLYAAITEASRAHLIEHRKDGEYGFVHDRVQEALLSRLDAAIQRELHQQAAEALDVTSDSAADHVYAVARHYALGDISLNPRRVYETNVAAGLKATEDFADEEAYAFLEKATEIAQAARLQPDPDLDAILGEICARTGRWSNAVGYLERALGLATAPLQRAKARTLLAQVYLANRQTSKAWDEVARSFEELGYSSPSTKPLMVVPILCSGLLGLALTCLRIGHGRASDSRHDRLKELVRLHIVTGHLAYLDSQGLVLMHVTLGALYPAHALGPSRELLTIYTGNAALMAALKQPRLVDCFAQKAIQLAEQTGDRVGLARSLVGWAWCKHMSGYPREAETLMRRSLDKHGQWLDAHDYVSACTDLGWNLLMRGYCREAWCWVQQAIRKAERKSMQELSLATDAAALLTILGKPVEAAEYLARARQAIQRNPAGRWRWSDFLSRSTLVYVEQEELGTPLEETIAQHRELGLRPDRAAFHARHFYVFQAYARLAQSMRAGPAHLHLRLADLRQALAQLKRTASHPTLRCHQLAIEGALARLEGQHRAALRILAQAESLAIEADNPWALFEIARQRAHTLTALDNPRHAMHQARVAYSLAIEHGWVNRAQWIRSEFSFDWMTQTPTDAPRTMVDLQTQRYQRHLDALLQVSLAASTTALDPDIQARVALDEIIHILGAERAFLFNSREDGKDLTLKAGRDAKRNDLSELEAYSRTVVETVRASRQPLVVSTAREGAVLAAESIVAHDLRSIIAAPLLMRERLVGVVYLDNRLARGVFTKDDLGILIAIANHIAIAIETADAFARQATLSSENTRLLDVLRRQVVELQRSRQLIITAEETRRREVAELLHGRVQTRLLIVWHRLGQCEEILKTDPAKAAGILVEIRQEIDEIREQEVREASHLLHPSIIRIGLVPAIRSLASRFEEHTRIVIDVDALVTEMDDPANNQISESLRLVAYRVIQEALNNTYRHANASLVEISLSIVAGQRLAIVVADNGQGFDSTALKLGLGLNSIAGRVGQVGGSWRICSTIGAGSRLEVVLPLDQNGQSAVSSVSGG